jgi:hypothetical protein
MKTRTFVNPVESSSLKRAFGAIRRKWGIGSQIERRAIHHSQDLPKLATGFRKPVPPFCIRK